MKPVKLVWTLVQQPAQSGDGEVYHKHNNKLMGSTELIVMCSCGDYQRGTLVMTASTQCINDHVLQGVLEAGPAVDIDLVE